MANHILWSLKRHAAWDWLRDSVVVLSSSKGTHSRGVGISGKFDQYFPVTTDEQPPTYFKKTYYLYGHYEPDHWPLSKFEVKIGYGNSGYYSLVAWMLRIYHVFREFTDQMENRAKDGIWELSALLSLAG